MDFSIVTPSYNMRDYLIRCHASIADQAGATYEHIVMDGGSTDGTVEWLNSRAEIISESRPDNGMYEAVNRGFKRTSGDIIIHLNCDEQLLPGTLSLIKRYFQQNESVDVVYGDTLTIRLDGSLVAYRKAFPLARPLFFSSPLYISTAATFLRRRFIEQDDVYDETYKICGDLELYERLSRKGYVFAYLRNYLSTFTVTGMNLSADRERVAPEYRRFLKGSPRYVSCMRPFWRGAGWILKAIYGCYYHHGALRYSVYGNNNVRQRNTFVDEHPSFRWRWE
jgi:glycosyltransferase involved in cell wall biosynthesis